MNSSISKYLYKRSLADMRQSLEERARAGLPSDPGDVLEILRLGDTRAARARLEAGDLEGARAEAQAAIELTKTKNENVKTA